MSDIVFTVFNIELSLFEPYLEISFNNSELCNIKSFFSLMFGLLFLFKQSQITQNKRSEKHFYTTKSFTFENF